MLLIVGISGQHTKTYVFFSSMEKHAGESKTKTQGRKLMTIYVVYSVAKAA